MLKTIKKYTRKFDSWMSYNPPGALSGTGWRLFNEEFSKKAPVRFYIKTHFKKQFVWPITRRYERISQWIRYRTSDKYHIVNTGLTPGYYSNDDIILHANFNILKTFVEVELSRFSCWSSKSNKKVSWWKKYIPFYYKFFPIKYNIEYSVKHLEWAATLDDPALSVYERSDEQAHAARETLELYNWWVNTRPARKEHEYVSYSDQGLGSLSVLDDEFDREAPDYKAHVAASNLSTKQEADWAAEDDQMLARLIKIRKHLWT